MSKKENFSVGPWHFHKQTLCYDRVIQVADLPTNAELKCFCDKNTTTWTFFVTNVQSWNILISSARNQLTPSRKPNQEPCILRRKLIVTHLFLFKVKKNSQSLGCLITDWWFNHWVNEAATCFHWKPSSP